MGERWWLHIPTANVCELIIAESEGAGLRKHPPVMGLLQQAAPDPTTQVRLVLPTFAAPPHNFHPADEHIFAGRSGSMCSTLSQYGFKSMPHDSLAEVLALRSIAYDIITQHMLSYLKHEKLLIDLISALHCE